MVAAVRITESGVDSRITESGDTRVTESFFEGLVSLSGTATLAAIATATVLSTADLQATGSKLFAGVGEFQGLVSLTSEASLTSEGKRERFVDSSFTSEGTITAEYIRETPGTSSLTGEGSLEAISFFRIDGDSSLTSTSSFVSDGDAQLKGHYTGFFEEAIRYTQTEDTRITESGDVRITNDFAFNTGVGTFSTLSTKIDFNAVAYYKRDSIWEPFVPYVKHKGVWQEPVSVYKKISGAWKRIY